MAVTLTISIDQNSQNAAKLTSNVTITVRASWTYGSYDKLQKSGWVKIDGTKYTFTSAFNTGQSTSGTCTLYSKTLDIQHNATTGAKTLSVSASYTTGVSSGTIAASASKVLTTIKTKSTLAASNGTLGTAQTLTVTRQSTAFTHTITYACGSASGTICTKSGDTSISWTPPLSLASQNTTGTTVSIKFTITTYSGSTSVGSNTKTISCSIPASVKPSCTVSVSDPMGYATTYGGYVKGKSKIKVTVTPTTSYGSAIKTYSTTVGGTKYSNASFTTGYVTSTGALSISSTVKDARGRTSSAATTSVTVLNYAAPIISKLSVGRCNEDGTANDQGEYAKVTFSYSITSLSGKNAPSVTLGCKKTTDNMYSLIDLTDDAVGTNVANYTCVFYAESSKTYDIRLTVTDSISTVTKNTRVSTAFTLMHWNAAGDGMGIGKVAELSGYLDIGMKVRFRDNAVLTNNQALYGLSSEGKTLSLIYANGNDNIVVGYGSYSNSLGATNIYGNALSLTSRSGVLVDGRNLSANKVLWSGKYYMTESQTCTLSEAVNKQANGIVLIWSEYDTDTGEAVNANFNLCFVPRYLVGAHDGKGVGLALTSATMNVVAPKYVYISNTTVTGYANNSATAETKTCGILTTPRNFVLRYIIGV